MQKPRYALVAYVSGAAGEFVENLRRELHQDSSQFAAHLTILPPRPLHGSETSAIELLQKICDAEEPFEVILGGVATFVPVTPTVYIRVDAHASRMSSLHNRLNTEALAFQEEWPYIPHMTIAKMHAQEPAEQAFHVAQQRWEHYTGPRRVLLEKLMFVREESPNCWVDLAPVHLGRKLVSR